MTAQTGVPGSTLELYRTALRTRHEHPALAGLDAITWLETEPGVLAFRRTAGDAEVTCVVNISGAEVTVSGYGRPLVASAELTERGDGHVLPVDAAAWFERR